MKDTFRKQKLLQKKIEDRRAIVVKMKAAVRHMLNILRVVGRERLGQMIQRNENLKRFA